MALTVPSSAHDPHLLSKLLYRKAVALEGKQHHFGSLQAIDQCLGLGLESTTEFEATRDRLIAYIVGNLRHDLLR